jgi:AcrR family transcriptional regulator
VSTVIERQTRRERLRAEATQEIKKIALELMSEGGPDAISLRAIAREMGMTPSALYGYFPTRDDLITTLIVDVYSSLLDVAEAARDGHPSGDPAGRILAWAGAVRDWALANPEGFRLIYGDPVPGYQPPTDGPAADLARRACEDLVGLVAMIWSHAPSTRPGTDFAWSDFAPQLAAHVREAFPDLPPAAVALALRIWGRMHGLLSLEIYGHLRFQTPHPGKLYGAEMRELIKSLGLTPPE